MSAPATEHSLTAEATSTRFVLEFSQVTTSAGVGWTAALLGAYQYAQLQQDFFEDVPRDPLPDPTAGDYVAPVSTASTARATETWRRPARRFGEAAVHWEVTGHSGISCPPWASATPEEIVRLLAVLMSQAAGTIPADVARDASALLRGAAMALVAQLPKEGA